MNANVIEVKPFNITKIELVALRGPKGDTGYPSPEEIQTAVDAWLDDHPEATTTVQDGAITTPKLADEAVTVDKLSESLQSLLITDTASGSIASFTDGSDGIPVRDLKVSIEPKQSGSGDPSPSNIRPITGWTEAKVTRTGKNLFSGTINQYNANNVLTTGTFLKAGTYKISVNWSGTLDGLYVRSQGTISAPIYVSVYNTNTATLTLANDSTVFVQGLKNSGINAENVTIQIETGSTATAYEPYQGTTITIPLGSTVYGGTLDVTTGVLTVKKVKHVASLGDSAGLYQAGTNANRVGIRLSDSPLTAVSERLNIISNIAKASTAVLSSATQAVGDCCMYSGGSDTFSTAVFGVPKTASSAADALAWLVNQGCEFVYNLATPTTVQLTPAQLNTLLGVNNIWSDAGDTSVEYYADTKLYIDLAGQTEDDMTANANISSGRYFQIGNTLYISTAAIAAGETIVPGTNCRKTTIAEALNALL